ncbi:MAG: hypothetical protein AAF548_15050 [Actinomycetota bacterium]
MLAPRNLMTAARQRIESVPTWVLFIEIFIGAGWLRAAAEKAISGDWWGGATLEAFLIETDGERVPWFHLVTDVVVWPNLALVSAAVAITQVALGVCLLTGRARATTLLVGIALNTSFVLAGAVDPSAFYLLAQLAVLLWVAEERRTPHPTAIAWTLAIGGLATAGSALLSIGTLHPEHVVDDPSMMLVFLGLLTAASAERLGRRPLAGDAQPTSISSASSSVGSAPTEPNAMWARPYASTSASQED